MGEQWPDWAICPLAGEVFKDPVATPCGHTYEREVLEQWLSHKPQDPQTRRPLSVDQLYPNRLLADVIAWFPRQRMLWSTLKAALEAQRGEFDTHLRERDKRHEEAMLRLSNEYEKALEAVRQKSDQQGRMYQTTVAKMKGDHDSAVDALEQIHRSTKRDLSEAKAKLTRVGAIKDKKLELLKTEMQQLEVKHKSEVGKLIRQVDDLHRQVRKLKQETTLAEQAQSNKPQHHDAAARTNGEALQQPKQQRKQQRKQSQVAAPTTGPMGASVRAARRRGDIFTLSQLVAAGYSLQELKAERFSAHDLQKAGFSLENLQAVGFSALELKKAGCSATALKKVGFTAAALKKARFSPRILKQAGFSVRVLKQARFSAKALRKAGFSLQALRTGGFTPRSLIAAGFSVTDLAGAGVGAAVFKEIGVPLNDLSPPFDMKHLWRAGYSAKELMNNHCSLRFLKSVIDDLSISDLVEEGFTLKELKQASFGIAALVEAGFNSAAELHKAGFTLTSLRSSGKFSTRGLIDEGFALTDLKAAGFEIKALKEVGVSAKRLRDAGFSVADLWFAGFTPLDFKDAGVALDAFRNLGFSATDLTDAGFSAEELATVNFSESDLHRQQREAEEKNRQAQAAAAGQQHFTFVQEATTTRRQRRVFLGRHCESLLWYATLRDDWELLKICRTCRYAKPDSMREQYHDGIKVPQLIADKAESQRSWTCGRCRPRCYYDW